ncbi:MAG: carboxypeptidase-like regulatory domain-containing protein [Candidatus Caldarchaeum sp.]
MSFHAAARAALLTMALLASSFLYLNSLPQAEAQTGVTFTIRTADGSQPVRWAVLKINGTDWPTPTNANGQVTVNTLNQKANCTSFQVIFRGISVANIPDFNATAKSSSNPSQITLNVNVTTMRINVRTGLGNPVANVKLSVSYGPHTNTTVTGGDGSAIIPQMPNTTYTISASYRGYDVGVFNRNYGGSPLTLTLNLFAIRAIVQDLEGNSVPSATVKVWYGIRPTGNTTGFASADTDSSGNALIDRLPAGDYSLDVVYRGETVYQTTTFVVVSGGVVDHVARTDLVRYRVRVLDADGVDLMTGINLEGRLFRGNTQYGDPTTTSNGELGFGLVRSRVYTLVVRMGDNEVFRGEVNAPADNSVRARFYDASFRIDAVGTPSERLVSTVNIRLSMPGYSVERTTINAAASVNNMPAGRYTYEITRGPYTIGSGTVEVNSDDVRISIRPTLHTVRLRITNDVNQGIPASAQLRTYDDVVLGVYNAGENGEVSVSGLIPVLYRGIVNFRNVVVNDGFEFLLNANNLEVVVRTRVYNVVFRVQDFDGEANIENAELSLTAEGISETMSSNSTGRASLKNIPHGSYRLAINYLNLPVHEENLRIEGSREITIKARGIIDVLVEVVDDEAKPVESGSVQLSIGPARFSEEVSDGKARFVNIPAGAYRVSAQYKGVSVYDRQASFSVDEETVRIPVAVYYLRLTVVKSDGTPLPTAYVSASHSTRKISEGFTDNVGRAELKLPRGDFSLEVVYQDTAVHSQSLSITQSTILNVRTKVYRVDVRILTPEGFPVQGAEVSLSRGDKLVERGLTDEEGRTIIYVADGDYTWTMKIGGYTYTSTYSSKQDKGLSIIHIEERPQLQGVVLAATAAVSFSSVFGLIRWGRQRPGGGRQRAAPQRRQIAEPERRPATLKRNRPPRV